MTREEKKKQLADFFDRWGYKSFAQLGRDLKVSRQTVSFWMNDKQEIPEIVSVLIDLMDRDFETRHKRK